MADPRADDAPAPPDERRRAPGDGGRLPPPRRDAMLVAIAVVVAGVALVAGLMLRGGAVGPDASTPQASAPSLSPAAISEASGVAGAGSASSPGSDSPAASASTSGSPGTSPPPAPAAASAGRLAIADAGGALSIIDARGGSPVSLAVPGIRFGPAAWSPDGTRVAVIGSGPDATAIYVFDVSGTGARGAARPITVFSSAKNAPFYLYWSPDGRRVAFLANEDGGISLRLANADGSPPRDGPAHDGVIHVGSPLYFEWETPDRLLLHVGFGATAFTDEVGLDGVASGHSIPGTGDFRTAMASGDGRFRAYVQGEPGIGELVMAPRDGGSPQRLPVFGPAAFAFDPSGTALASIAAVDSAANPATFPLGPLRLLDAGTGTARTLVDGLVVGFYWSPDGRTIAALRLAPAGGPSADVPAVLAVAIEAGPQAAATPPPAVEIHLSFVEVATGQVRGDRVIRLGDDFVSTILPYFDQYALSHRLWAPDGSAIALPLVDANGKTRVVVLGTDGAAATTVADATSAFWSP
jgi:TolB protein